MPDHVRVQPRHDGLQPGQNLGRRAARGAVLGHPHRLTELLGLLHVSRQLGRVVNTTIIVHRQEVDGAAGAGLQELRQPVEPDAAARGVGHGGRAERQLARERLDVLLPHGHGVRDVHARLPAAVVGLVEAEQRVGAQAGLGVAHVVGPDARQVGVVAPEHRDEA